MPEAKLIDAALKAAYERTGALMLTVGSDREAQMELAITVYKTTESIIRTEKLIESALQCSSSVPKGLELQDS